MKKAIQTDLALERTRPACQAGYQYEERDLGLCKHHLLIIRTARAAKAANCPKGVYHTLSFPVLTALGDSERQEIAYQLSLLLQEMAKKALNMYQPEAVRILVIGIGNRQQTVDAIGPRCADRIHATAHLPHDLRGRLCCAALAVFCPGVSAQSGIKSETLIYAAVQQFRPGLVILIDSLAARSIGRIGTTIQLTDTGIAPGSGVREGRVALNEETLGCPTLSIGCPTVTSSTTLLHDLLSTLALPRRIKKRLSAVKGCFVCPQQTDDIVNHASAILADAINRAFGVPDI